jgi:hypothetical protein
MVRVGPDQECRPLDTRGCFKHGRKIQAPPPDAIGESPGLARRGAGRDAVNLSPPGRKAAATSTNTIAHGKNTAAPLKNTVDSVRNTVGTENYTAVSMKYTVDLARNTIAPLPHTVAPSSRYHRKSSPTVAPNPNTCGFLRAARGPIPQKIIPIRPTPAWFSTAAASDTQSIATPSAARACKRQTRREHFWTTTLRGIEAHNRNGAFNKLYVITGPNHAFSRRTCAACRREPTPTNEAALYP